VLAILFVAIAWLLVTVTDMKRKIYNTVPRDCWRAKKKKKKIERLLSSKPTPYIPGKLFFSKYPTGV
jgi:hypothetical protein